MSQNETTNPATEQRPATQVYLSGICSRQGRYGIRIVVPGELKSLHFRNIIRALELYAEDFEKDEAHDPA